jgi:NADH-quinone oxidoreductase subunit M
MTAVFLLSAIIFLPAAGALLLAFIPSTSDNALRWAVDPVVQHSLLPGRGRISLPLVLTDLVHHVLAMGASWSITKHVKGYCILFLLLETGMLGVFMALDFFLFYVFWEVMLLPMYFLIGVWGGPRRSTRRSSSSSTRWSAAC